MAISNKGFSLIEILISITILSLIMIAIYNITENNINTKNNVILEDREYLQAQAVLNRISNDLVQIYSPLYHSSPLIKRNNKTSKSKSKTPIISTQKPYLVPSTRFPRISSKYQLVPEINNSTKTSISFMSTSNKRKIQDTKQSRYSWIMYSTERMEEKPIVDGAYNQIIRKVINEDIYAREHNWDNAKKHIMLKNIKDFSIKFWDESKEKYVESLEELKGKERLSPKLFLIEMLWYNQKGEEYKLVKTARPLWLVSKISEKLK